MSGRESAISAETGDCPELLRECILYGILFKAIMKDAGEMEQQVLKMSYHRVLEGLSRRAEREHYRLRQLLRQHGCELLSSEKEGSMYIVRYRQRGYYREAIYSIEVLRAECQQRLDKWAEQQGEG
ncbi:hypothetical protein [Brevibacillus sp. SYP-B805]|uniref:hypothetical protein n=1 Tax=Brevibacillus sp. SYP-B805 TaxID=1578199 RepID=UPI003216D3F4